MSVSSYRYLGDGDTDRHEIVHDVRYRSWTGRLPFESNPKYQILTANISKTVTRSVTWLGDIFPKM